MALQLPTPGAGTLTGQCIVMTTRANLPAEDQATLDGWLANPDIAAWRVGQSINVGSTAIKDHRSRRCACYRGEKP